MAAINVRRESALYTAAGALCAVKQLRQYTGRSPRGRNGTVVVTPHSAQTASKFERDGDDAPGPDP